MTEVVQNRPRTVTVVLNDSSSGDPLTGVTASDVTMYIRKNNQSPTQKSITASNFRELDTTNMPGLYEIDFSASDLDTKGELAVVIQENGGINLDQKSFKLQIKESLDESLEDQTHNLLDSKDHSQFIGWLDPGEDTTIPVSLQKDGEPVGNVASNVGLMYWDSSNGGQRSVISAIGNWTVESNGTYSFVLSSFRKVADGEVGFFQIYDAGDFAYAGDSPGNFFFGDYWYDSGSGYVNGFVTKPSRTVLRTTDGGDNWTSYTESSNGDYFYDVDGDGGGSNVRIVGENGLTTTWTGSGLSAASSWSSVDLFSISYLDSTNMWACGEAEEIIYYDGSSTTTQRSSGSVPLHSIHARSTSHVMAVGGDPNRRESFDDGSYDPSTAPDPGGALLLETTDGGSTWNDVTTRLPDVKSNESLRSIKFDPANPNRGIIVGQIGEGSKEIPVYYTQDGGSNWHDIGFTFREHAVLPKEGTINDEKIQLVVDTASSVSTSNIQQVNIFETDDLGTSWTKVYSESKHLEEPLWTAFSAPDNSVNYVGGADDRMIRFPTDEPRFDRVNYRYYSTLGFDSIKGSGYLESDDSLVSISDRVSTNQTKIDSTKTDIRSDISDVQGAGFDPFTDSLSRRGYEIPLSGEVVKDSTETISLRVKNRTGVKAQDLDATLLKSGSSSSTNLLSTWQEVDSVSHPGLYNFTFASGDLDTLGDLVVELSPTDSRFRDLEKQVVDSGISLEDTFFKTKGTGFAVESSGGSVYETSDGGGSWSVLDTVGGPPQAIDGPRNSADFLAVATEDGAGFIELYTGDSSSLSSAVSTDVSTGSAIGLSVIPGPTASDSLIAISGRDSSGYGIVQIYDVSDDSLTTTLQLSGNSSIPDVQAVNSSVVFAAGRYPSSGQAIWKSTDAGSSWSQTLLGKSGPVGVMDFHEDGKKGYAIGTSGSNTWQFYRTTDSGSTWSLVSEKSTSYQFIDIHVFEEDTVIVSGFDSSNNEPKLLTSNDATANLTEVELSGLSLGNTLDLLSGLDNEVWIVVNSSTSLVHYGYSKGLPSLKLRFKVVEDIKGQGFDPNADTLSDLRKSNDRIENDVNTVSGDVVDLQGTNFNSSSDSLREISSEVSNVKTDVQSVKSAVSRVLGLSQENYRITDQKYNNDNKLIEATIKLYNSKSDAENDTNSFASYSLQATYDSQGLLVDYLVTKEN